MGIFGPHIKGRSLWRYCLAPAEWSNSHTRGEGEISLFSILIWYSSDINYLFRDIVPDCIWSRNNRLGRARETFPLHYSRITPFARPGFLKLYIDLPVGVKREAILDNKQHNCRRRRIQPSILINFEVQCRISYLCTNKDLYFGPQNIDGCCQIFWVICFYAVFVTMVTVQVEWPIYLRSLPRKRSCLS